MRLKEIVTLIVATNTVMKQLQNEGAHRAQGGKHTYQGAAGRSKKGKVGNWEEEKVSGDRGKGGEGAGRSISAARTHSRFSK